MRSDNCMAVAQNAGPGAGPPRYVCVVVTPARNEGDNLSHTIRCMMAQSLRPARWMIVNDGSSDGTGDLADTAAHRCEWIGTIHREDRGFRKQGGGVIEAFYEGYNAVASLPWDFLVKLDADLSFDPDFFQQCLHRFHEDDRLGIGGGLICGETGGRLHAESPGDPQFHVRGATKIYRRECWQAIGGLVRAPGWDTVDEFKANMLGWKTRTFADIPLRHHRFTGSADGRWKNYVKFGTANYIAGYHPLFMAAKCLRRLVKPPYLVGGVGLAWGYLSSRLSGVQRVDDREMIAFVHRQQLDYLLRRPSLWDRTVGDLNDAGSRATATRDAESISGGFAKGGAAS